MQATKDEVTEPIKTDCVRQTVTRTKITWKVRCRNV